MSSEPRASRHVAALRNRIGNIAGGDQARANIITRTVTTRRRGTDAPLVGRQGRHRDEAAPAWTDPGSAPTSTSPAASVSTSSSPTSATPYAPAGPGSPARSAPPAASPAIRRRTRLRHDHPQHQGPYNGRDHITIVLEIGPWCGARSARPAWRCAAGSIPAGLTASDGRRRAAPHSGAKKARP